MATEKQKFIRHTTVMLVACHYQHPDTDRAIGWAEALWSKLMEKGYGEKSEPPESQGLKEDWYNKLSVDQQRWFCAFWDAFAHKTGRNRAAMRWHELGDLTDEQYRKIVAAAKTEAEREMSAGQVRKMAEGWLSERRWDDHAVNDYATQAKERRERYSKATADFAHAKSMRDNPNLDTQDREFWGRQVQKLQDEINQLNGVIIGK